MTDLKRVRWMLMAEIAMPPECPNVFHDKVHALQDESDGLAMQLDSDTRCIRTDPSEV